MSAPVVQMICAFQFSDLLLHFPRLLGDPFNLADLSVSLMASQDVGSFSPSQLHLRNACPDLIHFFLSLFFSFVLLSYVKSFLPFLEV